MRPLALLVAGTHSGVGETTVSLGLMGALRRRGLRVAPFKVGPDCIDPRRHAAAAGRVSHNLDGGVMTLAANRELYERASERADVCVVEGVMGLFDGFSGRDEAGSLHGLLSGINAGLAGCAPGALGAVPAPGGSRPSAGELDPSPRATGAVRVGVARDIAFSLAGEPNSMALRDAGAELIEFSSLADDLPGDLDGLLLGGGYPELHAGALEERIEMRAALVRFALSGRPVLAECGGLMLWARSCTWMGDGSRWPAPCPWRRR